jgi:hypothetical protein
MTRGVNEDMGTTDPNSILTDCRGLFTAWAAATNVDRAGRSSQRELRGRDR